MVLRKSPVESGAATIGGRSLFFGDPPAMRLGRLACPARRLGPQTLNLAPGQGNADLADPFQLYTADRLGIETREVDLRRRFSALDRLQISLAGLQAPRGLFAGETRQRMGVLAI